MKSIKRNLIYNAILKVTAVVFPLITAPYISRVLEPDGLGLFNFATTYAGYFALVALLGIPQYGIRKVSASRKDLSKLQDVVSELMTLSFLVTAGVCLVYFATLFFIGEFRENYLIFLVAGIALYLAPLKVEWFFSGMEEYGFITLRAIIIRTLSIVAMFLFVKTKSDLIIYVGISALSTVLTDVWNLTKMYKLGVRPHFKVKGIKKHLHPVLLLFSASIAISVYTVLDTVMLGFMSDYSQVGYYSSTSHLSKTLLALVTSLSVVAMPRMSYYKEEGNNKELNNLANKSLLFVSFFAIPMVIGIICLSPTFVPLFFGDKFYEAIIPLQIICLLIVAIGMNNITGVQILVALGYDKQFLYSVLTGTVCNFTMNMLLIPKLGAVGAAIASVTAEFLILFVTAIFVKKNTDIRFNQLSDIVKSLIGSIILIPIFLLLNLAINGWLLVVVFPIVGGLFYIAVQAIMKHTSYKLFIGTVKNTLKIRK